MPSIRAGQVVAFYLLDVAETIDLQTVPACIGGDKIYGFSVEQSSMSRGQFLELTVVLILVLILMGATK